MRTFIVILSFFMCMAAGSVPSQAADWSVGISGGNGGISGFSLSVGEYYRVPEREVIVVRERGVHDEELPVVFFLAKRAHVAPGAIVDLRLRGMSWMDITLHFGLSPEIYYVPVKVVRHGPPYGTAYGYYRKYPKHKWKTVVLRDRDIVDQVNLRFMSEHHHYAPERVMKYRSEGRNFVNIDGDLRRERHGKHDDRNRKEIKREEKMEKRERKEHRKEHGREGRHGGRD